MPTTSNQADAGGKTAGKAKEYSVNTIYCFEGSVHFITSDNVIFPFDLDRLAKVSSFFRDLGDIPQPSGKEVGTPVSGQTILEKLDELSLNEREDISTHTDAVTIFPECDAKALQPWLNLVSLGGAHGIGLNISYEECDTLYTLMDKYGCDESLYECLRSQIRSMAGKKEWEVFIMASRGNDRILGKRALGRMKERTFLEEGFRIKIRRLNDTWALAVYQAVYTADSHYRHAINLSWRDDLLAILFADV